MKVEGIPDGWDLDGIRQAEPSEPILDDGGNVAFFGGKTKSRRVFPILKKIGKEKRYRHFANAAEYAAKRRDGFFVDWKDNKIAPGFHAVVSTNELYCWVALGDIIKRFAWWYAFEKLEFRHADGSTSPFGVEVTE